MGKQAQRIARLVCGLLLDVGIIATSIMGIVARDECPALVGSSLAIFIASLLINLPRFTMEICIFCDKKEKIDIKHPKVLCIFYLLFTAAKLGLSIFNVYDISVIWGASESVGLFCTSYYKVTYLCLNLMQIVSCGFDVWFLVDSREHLRRD